jgi:hypothetical protein
MDSDIIVFADKYLGLKFPKHQVRWLEHITASNRTLLLGPRGHGKSTTVTYAYLAWRLCNDPSLRILIVAHKDQFAQSLSRQLRSLLDKPEIQEDFGLERGKSWKITEWYVKDTKRNTDSRYPSVKTTGRTGGVTGGRFDIVVFDDLVHETNVATEQMRQKIKNWITYEVMPTLDPQKKKIIVVGTRKHSEDWYSELLANSDYTHMVDKAIQDDGTALWPEVYPIDELEKIKREIGMVAFMREYQNEPIPATGWRFKLEWLKFYDKLPPEHDLEYYVGIDPSHGSTAKRASFFAVAVIAYYPVTDEIFIINLFRGKMGVEDQIAKANETIERYNPKQINIEAVLSYTQVYKAMDDRFSNVWPIDYVHIKMKGTTAQDKIARAENIIGSYIERGRVYFKKPDIDPFTKIFIDEEYLPFPQGEMDMFDALNLAVHEIETNKKLTHMPFYFPRTR